MNIDYSALQYGAQIKQMLKMVGEHVGVDDLDEPEFIAMMEQAVACSFADFDKKIAVGVENGCPAEKQMVLIAEMLQLDWPS